MFCTKLSCERLHSSARDFLRLEHLFKANVLTSIPVLYIKTKSTETTVIVTISFLPIRTDFLPSQQRVIGLTRKYVAPHLFCCHGVISVHMILQSYFDHILTGGRKCCLNVIPAGSFSLSLPLSFFISFPHANEPVCRPIIFTDNSAEIY